MHRIIAALAPLVLVPAAAQAYTAAGDRLFPATILLPQVAPTDEAYFTTSTETLHSATLPGSSDRLSNASLVYNKTLTERLSIGVEDGWNRFDQAGAGTAYGFQNLETTIKYLAVLDPDRELLVSVGADREWGGTGARGIGADASGATTPAIFVGKGMGGLAVDWLRPLAFTATAGMTLADTGGRANQVVAGVAIEYSIPYLESKVTAAPLPDFVRALTPMVEILYNTPSGPTRGTTTSGTIAPGLNYAGDGWELGLEMLIPATRSAGNGLGVTAQFHVALDYLFPDTVGRPLFAAR